MRDTSEMDFCGVLVSLPEMEARVGMGLAGEICDTRYEMRCAFLRHTRFNLAVPDEGVVSSFRFVLKHPSNLCELLNDASVICCTLIHESPEQFHCVFLEKRLLASAGGERAYKINKSVLFLRICSGGAI